MRRSYPSPLVKPYDVSQIPRLRGFATSVIAPDFRQLAVDLLRLPALICCSDVPCKLLMIYLLMNSIELGFMSRSYECIYRRSFSIDIIWRKTVKTHVL